MSTGIGIGISPVLIPTGVASGAAATAYLLDEDFTTPKSAPLTSPRTAEPGPGTGTIVDTGNLLSISGGALVWPATGATGDPLITWGVQTRVAGKLVIAEITNKVNNYSARVGWGTTVSYPRDGFRFKSGLVLEVEVGAQAKQIGTYTVDSSYNFLVMMRTTGWYYYVKGGSEFPNWTLVWVDDTQTGSEYPAISQAGASTNYTCDFIRIPDLTTENLPKEMIYDTFTRDDGAPGNTETTGPDSQAVTAYAWAGNGTIDTNAMKVTPSLGAELVTNGGFEGTYDTEDTNIDIAPSWNARSLDVGVDTASEETTLIHGGSSAQKFVVDATNEGVANAVTISIPANAWFRMGVWARGTGAQVIKFTSEFGRVAFNPPSAISIDATYAEKIVTVLHGTVADDRFGVLSGTGAGTYYIDDFTVKTIDLDTCVALLSYDQDDVWAAIDPTITDDTQAGLILRSSATSTLSGASYLHVYYNRVDGKIYVDQVAAGTPTNLSSTTATYSATARLVAWLSGTDLRVYYNEAFVVAETVTDSGNTIHGAFATDAATSWSEIQIVPVEDSTLGTQFDLYIP